MGFDNECIVNIQSLPGEYFCPVCRTLIYPNEALQSQCTHLYCKPCLSYIVATTQACPYDGYLVTEVDSKLLIETNKPLAETVGKVPVHCLFHRSGCQWQGILTDCIAHYNSCAYGNSAVVCNRCGTQIVHRQVQEHAQVCPGLQPQAAQQPVSAAPYQQQYQQYPQYQQPTTQQATVGPAQPQAFPVQSQPQVPQNMPPLLPNPPAQQPLPAQQTMPPQQPLPGQQPLPAVPPLQPLPLPPRPVTGYQSYPQPQPAPPGAPHQQMPPQQPDGPYQMPPQQPAGPYQMPPQQPAGPYQMPPQQPPVHYQMPGQTPPPHGQLPAQQQLRPPGPPLQQYVPSQPLPGGPPFVANQGMPPQHSPAGPNINIESRERESDDVAKEVSRGPPGSVPYGQNQIRLLPGQHPYAPFDPHIRPPPLRPELPFVQSGTGNTNGMPGVMHREFEEDLKRFPARSDAGRVGQGHFGNFEQQRMRGHWWCRICKIDCGTMDGLDLHSHSKEHERASMDMILNIKQELSMKPKMPLEGASVS